LVLQIVDLRSTVGNRRHPIQIKSATDRQDARSEFASYYATAVALALGLTSSTALTWALRVSESIGMGDFVNRSTRDHSRYFREFSPTGDGDSYRIRVKTCKMTLEALSAIAFTLRDGLKADTSSWMRIFCFLVR
jgi:hypothetical protein